MGKLFDTNVLTFGSDPETFAVDRRSTMHYLEPPVAFRREHGVSYKADPRHPVFVESDGIVVMEDGCAFEYTLPPTTNSHALFEEIQQGNRMLDDLLSGVKNGQFIRKTTPVANFQWERFLDKDDDYKLCLIFGCDPDQDAIETDYICHTIDSSTHPRRYGGGHIQVGSYDKKVVDFLHEYYLPMIRLMACLVGCASIANTSMAHYEQLRSEVYGRPGRYRIQKWGLEYRTPSNSWTLKESTLEEMIEGIKRSFELLQDPSRGKPLINNLLPSAILAIGQSDPMLAKEVTVAAWKY